MKPVPERKIADYEDIISMKRPVSAKHRPMPVQDRAAQFAPFAALTGYGDLIDENSRYVDARSGQDEDKMAMLDAVMSRIRDRGLDGKRIRVRYFVPDAVKDGGTYESTTGFVRRLDEVQRLLIFRDGRIIRLDDIDAIAPEE